MDAAKAHQDGQYVQELHDLELLVRSSTPLIIIETHEEERILELLTRLSLRLPKPLFKWTVTLGLQRMDIELEPQIQNSKPVELLAEIKTTTLGGIYVLMDFHPFLDDPVHVRLLKDLALNYARVDHTLVLVSHSIDLPEELERFHARFDLELPDTQALEQMVQREAKIWAQPRGGERMRVNRQLFDRFINSLKGLPLNDARRLARRAIQDDGVLDESDLPEVMKAKFELLAQDGVLHFTYDTARFADIAGLSALKRWLELRETTFAGKHLHPGLDRPKGIMLLGVQGCGKSLAAKTVAGSWGVPLLQLDFGSGYNKFHGETERNLRESLKTAQTMAPCVLWVDEIEKGVSTGSNDGGTSQRVLGTLLTWMAENDKPVFIVATANNIESLPPELLRKGRLDEIFFVDLPDTETRAEVFRIHLKRRELDSKLFDLKALAEATEGFSGAEIEQVVVSALYAAVAHGSQPGSAHVLQEVRRTRPLSVVMAERISALRDWARDRTVAA